MSPVHQIALFVFAIVWLYGIVVFLAACGEDGWRKAAVLGLAYPLLVLGWVAPLVVIVLTMLFLGATWEEMNASIF